MLHVHNFENLHKHSQNFFISPVAISITWKMVPHEILLWIPVHWAMLVQKLHDATLASLSVLKKNKMASKMVAINQENGTPGFNKHISLCLKCSIYDVNNIKKIILRFDPHFIIMRQDGGQDGCHNHTKSNISVIKRHSSVA